MAAFSPKTRPISVPHRPGRANQLPPTIPGKLSPPRDPCGSAVKERYTDVAAEKRAILCRGRTSSESYTTFWLFGQ
jgi:hypothetical protein